MNGYVLRLRESPAERIDLSALSPGRLAGLGTTGIERLIVGTTKQQLKIGDLFSVSEGADDTLTIEGGSDRFDNVGEGLDGGTVIVNGDAGAYVGRKMTGGRIEVRGNVGPWLASGLSGGLILVKGSAGDRLGAISAGDRFGMIGGTVLVEGNAGARAGDKMRRGTVVVRGGCGPEAGARMIGGTIWAERGFAEGAGVLMRRGTLIGPHAQRMLPTFVDCGAQDLVILRILMRYLADVLGPLAPKPIGTVRKFAGDMATIGKGELLLTA